MWSGQRGGMGRGTPDHTTGGWSALTGWLGDRDSTAKPLTKAVNKVHKIREPFLKSDCIKQTSTSNISKSILETTSDTKEDCTGESPRVSCVVRNGNVARTVSCTPGYRLRRLAALQDTGEHPRTLANTQEGEHPRRTPKWTYLVLGCKKEIFN